MNTFQRIIHDDELLASIGKTILRIALAFLLILVSAWAGGMTQDAFGQEQAIIVIGDTVPIRWADNPEPDILGYEVESATDLAGPWTKAHEGLIFGTMWEDPNINYGEKKFYRLYAVDFVMNRSNPSEPSLPVIRDYVDPDIGESKPSTPGPPQPQGEQVTLIVTKTIIKSTEFRIVRTIE
jgi:hypothetical protein